MQAYKTALLLILTFISSSLIASALEAENNRVLDSTSPFIDYNLCNSALDYKSCTNTIQPVCAYIKNCQLGVCAKTVINACRACSDSTVQAYINGTCESLKQKCDPTNRPQICFGLFKPVCAISSNCYGTECTATKSNQCFACHTNGADYTLPGDCPPKANDEEAFCDASNRPQSCSRQHKPVCGYKQNCIGMACASTFNNACLACAQTTTDYYIQGEC